MRTGFPELPSSTAKRTAFAGVLRRSTERKGTAPLTAVISFTGNSTATMRGLLPRFAERNPLIVACHLASPASIFHRDFSWAILRDMDTSPTSVSFLQALESLTKEDYNLTLQTLGRKYLFAPRLDHSDESHRISENYPAFDAAIQCHAPDPDQDFDEELTRSLTGLELSAIFLVNLLEIRKDGDPLKSHLLAIKSKELVTATKDLFSVPLDVLTEKTRDWPVRFPAFAAFIADLCAVEEDGIVLHGACVFLLAVVDVAADSFDTPH